MTPERYRAAFNCLYAVVCFEPRVRRTDIVGLACQYGRRAYRPRLKREEVEAVLGLTVRELFEKMDVPFGKIATRRKS